ncbi:MAG: ABC transporter ATP-binding protein/permease [Halobacteriales archaeon]|nr:ABC transporter ATP-binding protein/permease [Halobacteriales archaeon]
MDDIDSTILSSNFSNPMLRLLSFYGASNIRNFLVGFLANLFARISDLVPPFLLGVAIDSIILRDKPFLIPFLSESSLPQNPISQFWFVVFLIVSSFILSAILHWFRNWGWNSFSQNIQHQIRIDTYTRLQNLNMSFFDRTHKGELMSILSNDVNRLEIFLNDGFNSVFRLAIMVIGIATLLFYMNPSLAVVSLFTIPIIAFFTYNFTKSIQPKYAEVRDSVGKLHSRLKQNLNAIQLIKLYNTESYESSRVEETSLNYYNTNWDSITTRIKFFPSLQIISGIGFTMTFLVGGFWVISGDILWLSSSPLYAGEFVTFMLLHQQLVWPMTQFGQVINMYQRARASTVRIFGLIDKTNTLPEKSNPSELIVDSGTIIYEDVSFGYSQDKILSNISFKAGKGESLAIVGHSGSGKSTLLRLLLRLYDIDHGSITIDGHDIRDLSLKSLRDQIGYVGQDIFLFHGTVRENIQYGSFTAKEEELIQSAKAAKAHDFIMDLPHGYETIVGERGIKLSGGQRQRIAIARALLKDPPIFIFDEATSDVDTPTESLILDFIKAHHSEKTILAIAHRLSTIQDSTNILVLQDGVIIESGTHNELLNKKGSYFELWSARNV